MPAQMTSASWSTGLAEHPRSRTVFVGDVFGDEMGLCPSELYLAVTTDLADFYDIDLHVRGTRALTQ
jgi:hypothetical protein